MSMITYAEQHYSGNPNRVYVTGASSGAMMTDVLLGDYPDVFQAGAAFMGVPFGCFYTGTVDGWNSACADGDVIKTPQQWGDLVRAADPGYRGPRPRMQLWHGTADTTLYYPNFGEEIKQWTNVLNAHLAYTDHPQPTWTHTVYVNRAGQAEVDAYSVAGETHNLGFDDPDWAQYAVQFFGLTGQR
jgi:poly(hydroxyalkanoate) depolymerase family esterase